MQVAACHVPPQIPIGTLSEVGCRGFACMDQGTIGLVNRASMNPVKEKREWYILEPGIEKTTYGPECRMNEQVLHAKICYSSVSPATDATFHHP